MKTPIQKGCLAFPLPRHQGVHGRTFAERSCSKAALITAGREGLLSTDSVEKVGLPKLPDHLLVKTPFSHAAT